MNDSVAKSTVFPGDGTEARVCQWSSCVAEMASSASQHTGMAFVDKGPDVLTSDGLSLDQGHASQDQCLQSTREAMR